MLGSHSSSVSGLHKPSDFTYNVGHVLNWARQCTEALSFIYDEGLVHRDLKPGKSVSVFLKILFIVLFFGFDITNKSVGFISTVQDRLVAFVTVASNIIASVFTFFSIFA